MTRLQLRVYRDPGQAEAFLKIKQKDSGYYTCTVIVDTGAEVSLLPDDLMEELYYRLSERGSFEVTQAGIAKQVFVATEAYVTVYLEDMNGTRTAEFEILVWFTETINFLIGFGGILERAILHLDTSNLAGYLEFP